MFLESRIGQVSNIYPTPLQMYTYFSASISLRISVSLKVTSTLAMFVIRALNQQYSDSKASQLKSKDLLNQKHELQMYLNTVRSKMKHRCIGLIGVALRYRL